MVEASSVQILLPNLLQVEKKLLSVTKLDSWGPYVQFASRLRQTWLGMSVELVRMSKAVCTQYEPYRFMRRIMEEISVIEFALLAGWSVENVIGTP